jgi:hypothetical protein
MANPITITGFKEFNNKLKSLPKEVKDEAGLHVRDAAEKWSELAQLAAPVDQGFLRARIKPKEISQMNWEVISASEGSAWMEWGTKRKAKVPAAMAAYAQQFKGKGNGTAEQAINNLMGWVERKGIRFDSAGLYASGKKKGQNKKLSLEQTAYIIFHFIMINGIKPQPFFFKHKQAVEAELVGSLRQLLSTQK